ncbi:MAG: NUDIX hydrolase [Firmicutes bacterium]|nr:NUDIX hydrolase [Bacillota bacterium]
MNEIDQYKMLVESIINIFTVEKGNLKVLLMKKTTEPYRGYWILPNNIVSNEETIEENVSNTVAGKLNLADIYLEQNHVFSKLDRDQEERVVGISYIGLVDYTTANLKLEDIPGVELAWFNISDIPKMGYDHEEIVKASIKYLRKILVNSKVLKHLFPSDFTLPEIQKVYEQILGRKLDRRNFRKKFINLGIVIDTGYKNEGSNGRPGKLYRFNDEIRERDLF